MKTKNARAIDADESAWLADVKGCLTESCTRPVIARGLCQTCYVRLRRQGTIQRLRLPSLQEYIRSNSSIDCNGCWIWKGAVDRKSGYGKGCHSHTRSQAHRLSFMAFKGTIPHELQVNHKCHFRRCVNPEHIYLGTQVDNMRDMKLAGRSGQPHGEKCGLAKLTDEKVRLILRSSASARQLRQELGVSDSLIRAVRKRLIWRHVDA